MFGAKIILGVYLIYALAAMAFVAVRPGQRSVLIAYFGGWLLLPVALYDPATLTSEGFTLDVIGTALPSDLLFTKALIVPLSIMGGLVLRARTTFAGFRPVPADAAMALFCLSPMLALAVGRSAPADALFQIGYLTGTWGGSWMIGRVIMGDDAGRGALVAAMAFSGLCLLPVAIVEGLTGPRLYMLLYGAHPFYADGASRYFGARPLALFEHGNQYGIWIGMAALAAFHLALTRKPRPHAVTALAVILAACTITSQSVGAILLVLLGALWIVASARMQRSVLIGIALLLGTGGGLYLAGKGRVESIAYHNPVGQAAVSMLRSSGRGSLSWRVHRDLEAVGTIGRAALTGYGRWDWWRPLGSHPWGLPFLLAGQFGLISLALLAFALLAGPLRILWQGGHNFLPIIVVLSAMDAQLNSFVYFIAALAAAAVAGQSGAARSARHLPFPHESQHAH